MAYSCLFTRRLIICAKYGFYRPDELERLCHPAPRWSSDKTERKFIGRGWINPKDYPGLIEDELVISMQENDVSLEDISFSIEENAAQFFQSKSTNSRFKAQKKFAKDSEITAAFLLAEILKSVYERNPLLKKSESNMNIMTLIFALALPSVAIITSLNFGQDFFGTSLISFTIAIGTSIGLFLCHQLLLFGLLCRFDYNRRKSAVEILGDAIEYPGIRLSKIYPGDEELGEHDEFLFLDMEKRSNVFAWTLARRVLKSFGEAFYNRIQGYTSILFLF